MKESVYVHTYAAEYACMWTICKVFYVKLSQSVGTGTPRQL